MSNLPPPDYRRLSDLQSGVDDYYLVSTVHRLLAAQAAEVEALRADADRYRFLRDDAWGKAVAVALLPSTEMDAAVDAAINAALNEPPPQA